MRKRLILICMAFVWLTGCASHYYRVEADQVSLYLKNTEAIGAELACSLDGYQLRPATLENGRWVVTLPGDRSFRYFYFMDGEPFVPNCRFKENDDFGSKNCVFEPGM